MSSIIPLILAIFKAFPILEKWFDQIHDAKIDNMKKANHDSIEQSAKTDDQRPIEIAIGSTEAGNPSGIDGAVIRKTLPGVK